MGLSNEGRQPYPAAPRLTWLQSLANLCLGRHYARFWRGGRAAVLQVSDIRALDLVLTHNVEWVVRNDPSVLVEPLTWDPCLLPGKGWRA